MLRLAAVCKLLGPDPECLVFVYMIPQAQIHHHHSRPLANLLDQSLKLLLHKWHELQHLAIKVFRTKPNVESLLKHRRIACTGRCRCPSSTKVTCQSQNGWRDQNFWAQNHHGSCKLRLGILQKTCDISMVKWCGLHGRHKLEGCHLSTMQTMQERAWHTDLLRRLDWLKQIMAMAMAMSFKVLVFRREMRAKPCV